MGRLLVCLVLCTFGISQAGSAYGFSSPALKSKASFDDGSRLTYNSKGKLHRRWADAVPIIFDANAVDKQDKDHVDVLKQKANIQDYGKVGKKLVVKKRYLGLKVRRRREVNDAALKDTLNPENFINKKGGLSVVIRHDDVKTAPEEIPKISGVKTSVGNEDRSEGSTHEKVSAKNAERENSFLSKQVPKNDEFGLLQANQAKIGKVQKSPDTAGKRYESILAGSKDIENVISDGNDNSLNTELFKREEQKVQVNVEASNPGATKSLRTGGNEKGEFAKSETLKIGKATSDVKQSIAPVSLPQENDPSRVKINVVSKSSETSGSGSKEMPIPLSISEDHGETKNNVRKRDDVAVQVPGQELGTGAANVQLAPGQASEKQETSLRAKKDGEPDVSGHPGHHPTKQDEQETDPEKEAAEAESQRDQQSPEISHADRDTINANKNSVQALSNHIEQDKGEPGEENGNAPAAIEGGDSKDLSSIPKVDHSLTLFTIANTDIGLEYSRIPYRERYLWDKRDAPCHAFTLKVPDETEENSTISVCIFRPNLEFPDETKMFILNADTAQPEEEKGNQQRVFGYVMNTQVSSVYGRIVDKYFYGEVSIFSRSLKSTAIYVVEEIGLLNRLMRNNQKTLKHMLMVMHKGGDGEQTQVVYNAVVTKGASLIDFMLFTSPGDINRNPFIMLSTNHNSYIIPGEPLLQVDENGEIQLEAGNTKITVENDGTVHMITAVKSYTFRPHGRTIITQGTEVRTLQEHEGSVAVTAFTSHSSYDCVLPTPAFQPKRKGGYVCKVCMAVDDLFSQYYIDVWATEKEAASNYLARIIDRVSWMLRAMDFDEDKKPDNIGLDYDAQSVRWTYPDNNKEDVTDQDIEVLFQSLGGYEFSDCCLGIGFTMKNFPQHAFARRPAEADKVASPTGVCAGKTGRIPNNLIIISANNKRGNYSAISEQQLAYLTAHEIAGAFGALPDGDGGDDVCDQFLDEHRIPRHYLMWPDVMRNTTLKEHTLSSCSRKDIVKTLSTCKSACFDVDRHPFCGNGIVEEGEECDCGNEYNCKLQTCCNSRMGKYPCRKSGIGCKASSTPARIVLNSGMLLFTLSFSIFASQ